MQNKQLVAGRTCGIILRKRFNVRGESEVNHRFIWTPNYVLQRGDRAIIQGHICKLTPVCATQHLHANNYKIYFEYVI